MKNNNYISISQSLILLGFGLLFLGFNSCKKQSQNPKYINIVFRLDDFSNYSDIEIESKIFEIFEKHHLKLTIGIIPFTADNNKHSISNNDIKLSTEKENLLKKILIQHRKEKSSLFEIALHGYKHKAINYNTVWLSEFSELEYDEQKNRIELGKSYLEKLINDSVNIFIPPWNSYDKTTLKVLEDLHFKIISGGPEGIANKSKTIKYIPFTCEVFQLKDAINSITNSSKENPATIIALFHPNDFKSFYNQNPKLNFHSFEQLLIELKQNSNINIHNMMDLIQTENDFSEKRFLSNKKIFTNSKFLPPQIFNSQWHIYYNPNIDNILLKINFLLFIYYLTIIITAIISIWTYNFISIKVLELKKYIKYFSFIVYASGISLITFSIYDFDINYRGLSVIVFSLSTIVVQIISQKKHTEK